MKTELFEPDGDSLVETISSLQEHAQSFVATKREYQLLYERAPIAYLELDDRGRILRANAECEAMLNGSGTSLPGKSVFNFLTGSDVRHLRKQLIQSRDTNKPLALHLSLVNKEQSVPVEMRIRKQNSNGNGTEYLAVVLAGPDRARVLHTAPTMGSVHASSLQELIVHLGQAQTVAAVSQTLGDYCRKSFCSPAGLVFVEHGGELSTVYQWRARQVSNKYLAAEMIRKGPAAQAFRSGRCMFWSQSAKCSVDTERYLRRLLPGRHPRSLAFIPLSDGGSKRFGVVAMMLLHDDQMTRDLQHQILALGQIFAGYISRAKAYDDALAARAAAETENRRKEEFLSALSHELRNPLTPILGWALALNSGTLSPEKQSLAVEGIARNAKALSSLIEDLLDVARISSGKLRLNFGEARIQDLVRDALAAVQQAAENKKLRISTDISEAIPPLMADSRRIRQVLINLLNNAIKFTPSGGTIGFKVVRHGDTVECALSDTGRGILPEFLPFVFEPFRQENRLSKAKTAGLGLGLAIVRQIVELHDGTIKVHSRGRDQGATFVLRLPIRRHKHHS
jgi:signal transduction histidine kinase